jgi:site-specific recombinase XerD
MTRDFTPRQAVERYIKERSPDISDSTEYNILSSLRQFLNYCDQEGVEVVSDIDPFLVSDYRLQRNEEVNENTVYNNLSHLRVFLRWCEGRELVNDEIAENMILPKDRDNTRDEHIEAETAEKILAYLRTYEYATLKHALFSVLWTTGIRIGAARSLNLENFDAEEGYIELQHKPEEETPLKNRDKSEREVNLSSTVVEVLSDYIEARRHNVTDDFGNKPLFSSKHGRMHRTTLRKHMTTLTRPCHYSNECPHDRDMDSCEATDYNKACKCPSSVSPHPIRRSTISHWLDEGHPKELLSDRMDVSTKVLDEHYDARSEEQKRKLRREMLDIE